MDMKEREVRIMYHQARFSPHNIVHQGKKWSVAIYVRLSDEDRDKRRKADQSQSIQNQISYLNNYLEMMNGSREGGWPLELYQIYCDDDCTGMNFDREDFCRMMRDVENGMVDCIMVKTLSRLGRNDREMQQYLKEDFEKDGREIRVCAIGDAFDSLYQDPMNDIEIGIRLMMNEQYSQTQHTNVMIGMHTMQKDGKYIGAFAPYGYRKDPLDKHHLLIDEEAAMVVRRIFEEYLGGKSPGEIARGLTGDGIENPSTYKRRTGSNFVCGKKISDRETHWISSTVKRILMDEVYTGTVVQHKQVKKRLLDKKPVIVPEKERIRVENMHEPVISRLSWQTARGMMRTVRRDTAGAGDMIFKGVLKCGDCGHAMRKRYDRYETARGDVHRYLYYNCGTYRDHGKKDEMQEGVPGCTSHYISDKTIRNIVLEDINKMLARRQDLQEIVCRLRKEGSAGEDGLKKLAEAKEREVCRIHEILKNARKKWLAGKMTDAEYEESRDALESDMRAVRASIAEVERQSGKGEDTLDTPWVRGLLADGRLAGLDRITVVKLVRRIEVYADKTIRIVYNFSYGL